MDPEILFVDDDPDILAGFQRSLRKEFRVDVALGGAQALEMMRRRKPYSVAIADMRMPGMTGVEFLVELERMAPETTRMMLTGNVDQETARNAVNQGHIFRFLNKPCPHEELLMAIRAGLRQHQLVTAERDVLEQTLNGCARMLSDILSTHDAYAFGQAQRLREHMRAFAEHLKLNRTWDLELAAMLSHIGYVTIPQAVLAKLRFGGTLAEAEADMVRRMPQIGHTLLSRIPRLESVAAVILYQNKNFDGSGFPVDDVAGEQIPIGARILRVLQDLTMYESADVSKAKALENMTRFPGRYDPNVVGAVAKVFEVSLSRMVPADVPTQAVRAKNLQIGCTLAADARTKGGMMIIPAGTRVSPMLVEKLRNFANMGELEEPLQVSA
jgi:response regulator RpfG family c-di-GMP phosphodiesterase